MKSIRFKLWTGMMILVVLVLILLWFFQIVFLQSFYTNMRISNIKNEVLDIVSLQGSKRSPELLNKLDVFTFNNNLSVELINTDGSSVYSADSTGTGMQMPMMRNNNARLEAFNEGLKGNSVSIPNTHPRFGNKFMMIGLPVKTEGKITGVIIINMPLAAVEETAHILKWQLFYITLILLMASILITYFISKSFTKPILEIKKTTDLMASGDFSARVYTSQKDEIGILAETVNYLGQQLSKIDKLRKDLIANVSHELRTPLSLIRGYAEIIRDVTGNNPEKRERQLGVIIEETDRLGRIVDDILNLSQLQSGYFELNIGRFSVNETLDAITKRYEILSEKSGIAFKIQGPDKCFLNADEGRIQQVLYNLINNAYNNTPVGGTITVRVTDIADKVRFEVSDTGCGIPADELPYIWDRFYKADKTGEKKSAGTGLGLSIVKNVLEAHKAVYGAVSEINTGTTFWFELKKSGM